MFCQSCGFEYTQKTNYCKRCGGNLTSSDKPPVVQLPTLKITGVFFVIAAFVLFSLMFVYSFYWDMVRQPIRGPELFVPFVLGIGLIVALLAIVEGDHGGPEAGGLGDERGTADFQGSSAAGAPRRAGRLGPQRGRASQRRRTYDAADGARQT